VPEKRGLPTTARMRHDHHFVEQLAVRHAEGIGQNIAVDSLIPNRRQPRQLFEAIDELVASIREVGVLEPLLVRREPQGFQIISGERRYRAAVEAGLDKVPCIVLDVDDAQVLTIALIENLQRQDLSPFEEAEGLRALVEQFDQVATLLSDQGLEVHRNPLALVWMDEPRKRLRTWFFAPANNVWVERHAGHGDHVWLPCFCASRTVSIAPPGAKASVTSSGLIRQWSWYRSK